MILWHSDLIKYNFCCIRKSNSHLVFVFTDADTFPAALNQEACNAFAR